MPEDIDPVQGITEEATAESDSGYGEILKGEAEAPQKTDASAKAETETNAEVEEKPHQEQAVDEIELELGDKVYPVKQSELREFLENRSKFAEREKTLIEKEKSMNRDYTQKTQAVASFKQSMETAFGRMPEQVELQSLGKVYKAYQSNPQARQAIDSILSGRPIASNGQNPSQGSEYTAQLENKIAELEERLNGTVSSLEERERSEKMAQAKSDWDSWEAEKSKQGIKITDEIDQRMSPFVAALKRANPSWTSNQILDAAYRHATIDDLEKTVTGKVLKSADDAKKGQIPRIKPKSSAKPDSEKSYADFVREAV